MIEVDQVLIPDHVTGYPDIAFGGYVAGLLAARAPAEPTVRVDFRRRVAVGVPLRIIDLGDGGHALVDAADAVLAESIPATLSVRVPPFPSLDRARAHTEAALPGRRVTDCYGCGSGCAPGEGLHLYPSPLDDLIVAAWTPDPVLAGPDGVLLPENLWAALDCPGGWAGIEYLGMRHGGALTAALTATNIAPVRAGAPHLSVAWPIAAQGRKFTVGVAVADADGALCAVAEALWVHPRSTA
ncbi:hypothetical protein ACTD5D_26255 [Nocardia takedensis]|uniref:hypothetical protein n=1 Tax=Nocardia takedensis TaxID=259390 RepID=UPI0002F18360|nr:hypothetical protein [Nocardia takedensis]